MTIETHKLVIAKEYLETAAILWLHNTNLFASVHLAAAAEELSGKACRIRGMSSHYDEMRERVTRALTAVGIEYTDKQLREAVYSAKNSIKHMDSGNDVTARVDARLEAACFIASARRNFETLGLGKFLSDSVQEVTEASLMQSVVLP